ncbi:unnamed protein product [Closterium sp. NIES-53]
MAKGFMQKEKQDFNEIFAPTAKPPTLRVLTSKCDESLFLKGEGEKLVLFLVCVDDILLFSSSMKEIQNVQQQLMENFKCKNLREVKYYFGMHVQRDPDYRWLKLHQEKFIKELREKYGIENERKVATPLPAEFKLVKVAEDEGVEAEEQQQFQSLVGSLLYAAVHTRPGISFSVGQLARVVQNPSEEQVDAAERVVKYLNSHPSIGVQYSASAQVDPLPLAEPAEVTVDSGAAGGGAARGAASGGAEPVGAEPGGAEPASAEPGGAEPEGAELGGAETESAEPRGAESEGTESRGAEPRGTASGGGPASASPRHSRRREPLSQQQLRKWFAWCTRLRSGTAGARGPAAGGTGAGGAGATSPGDAGVTAGAGGTGGAGAAGPGGARTRARGAGAGGTGAGGVGAGGTGAGDPGAGGAGAGGTRAGDPGAGGTGPGDPRARGAGAGGAGAGGAGAGGTGAGGAGARGAGTGGAGAGGAGAGGTRAGGARAGDHGARGAGGGGAGAGGTCAGGTVQWRPSFSQPQLQPDSPLLAPSPYAEQTDSLTERREPESRPASPVRAVRTGRRVPRPRPPPVPSTHIMALHSSSVPLRVPLLSPPASPLAGSPDPESDLVRAVSPTVRCLLATVVTDPSFESAATSSLVIELVDFAAACRLDYVRMYLLFSLQWGTLY